MVDNKNEFGGAVNSNTYARYYSTNFEASGTPKGYDIEAMVSDPQGNISDIISLARYYYYKNGLIMRTVNIIRDFGIGEIKLDYPTKNRKAKKIIEDFNKRIDIQQVLKDFLFEKALTGNCAGYNRNGKRIDIYPINKIEVSPLIINNKPVLNYINDVDLNGIDIDKNIEKKLKMSYPREIADGIKKGKDKITLNVDNTFFDKVNSSRYEPYGVTFLLPAFDELSHKSMLKEAEKSTASGIIEKILRISVGDKDHPPQQKEIDFYDDLISGQKGSIKATVPYFVNMDWIEPNVDIFGTEKFEQVDKDLLSALGISLTLIRGEGGGNYSEGVISIAGLIKTIESLRENIPTIVQDWYTQELIKNGINISNTPKVSLPPVEIDKSTRMEMTQWLFEHAGLPYEILYKEFGYDYTSVKLTREGENGDNTEDVFKLRQQPFQGQAQTGAPSKNLNDRKTDPNKSNNDQPKPSTSK